MELDVETKKLARQSIKQSMVLMVDQVIEGSLDKKILINFLLAKHKIDEMLLDFVYDEEGNRLKPKHRLKQSELNLGVLESESSIIH